MPFYCAPFPTWLQNYGVYPSHSGTYYHITYVLLFAGCPPRPPIPKDEKNKCPKKSNAAGKSAGSKLALGKGRNILGRTKVLASKTGVNLRVSKGNGKAPGRRKMEEMETRISLKDASKLALQISNRYKRRMHNLHVRTGGRVTGGCFYGSKKDGTNWDVDFVVPMEMRPVGPDIGQVVGRTMTVGLQK